MAKQSKQRSAAAKTLYAIEHHAKPIREVALYIASLAQMLGYKADSSRGGPNSWWLLHPDGRRGYLVRARQKPWRIEINGKPIKTRAQAVRWFDTHT